MTKPVNSVLLGRILFPPARRRCAGAIAGQRSFALVWS